MTNKGKQSTRSKAIRKHFATECEEKNDITFLVVDKCHVGKDGEVLHINTEDVELSTAIAGERKHMVDELKVTNPSAPRYDTDTCDQCGIKESREQGLCRCAACDSAMYCSSTCQREAWTLHKQLCREKMIAGILEVWKGGGAVYTPCGTKKKVPIHKMIFATFREDEYCSKKGMFLRHLNRNFQDNKADNLAQCHP